MTFNGVKDIVINGLKSVNSQTYHIGFNGCENVKVQNVLVLAPDESPNTDGIHVQKSTGVTITNSGMKTGDDCISVGPGTRNLWVQHVACGPGHGIRLSPCNVSLIVYIEIVFIILITKKLINYDRN